MYCGLADAHERYQELNDIGISYLGKVYSDAKDWLCSLKPRHYDGLLNEINRKHSYIKMLITISACGIREDKRLARLDIEKDEEKWFYAMLDIIGESFPIEGEFMYEEYFENGDLFLVPAQAGMNGYSSEDLWEAVEDPESYFTMNDSLRVFIKWLDGSIDGEGWDVSNQYFRWDVPIPPSSEARETYLNTEKIEDMLRNSGMEIFFSVIDVACGSDNIFFDLFMYDHDVEIPDFTKESFDRLSKEWVEAKKILDLETQALEMCQADPGLYQKFADIWGACLERREPERIRVRA